MALSLPTRPMSLPIRNLHVATNCPAKWAEMDGDDRKRFCHQCSKHVYRFDGMTADEVRDLLAGDADVCGQFWRRADGTVLTADCPVGVRLARSRWGRWVLRAAAFALTLGTATLAALASADGSGEAFAHSPAMTALQRFTGQLTPPRYLAGDILIPVDD